MNPHGSVEVPDHVPAEWQQRYGSACGRDEAEGPSDDELRARAVAVRLLVWAGVVTASGVVVMWPATYLPRLLGALAIVGLGGPPFWCWLDGCSGRRPWMTPRRLTGGR